MDTREAIAELLLTEGATVLAFGPLAASGASVPAELGIASEQIIEAENPLELLDPGSHAAAVIAFEQATRHGHGTAIVMVSGSTEATQLHLFDLSLEYGVILAVMTPSAELIDGAPEPVTLPARRAIFRQSLTGAITAVESSFTELLGWAPDEVVGESTLSLLHPDDHEAALVAWAELLNSPGGMTRIRQRLRHRDGSWLWCEASDRNDLDDPSVGAVVCELVDVSREVAAHAALQRRETMLDRLYRALPAPVLVLEVDGTVAVVNERWESLLGDHEFGPYHALLARCDDRARIVGAIDRSIHTLADAELSIDLNDGTCRHADLHISPLVERDVHVGVLLMLAETTTQRHHAEELAEQMRRDVLTGALNRLGIREQIEQRLAGDGDFSVLYVDIDDFKLINDRHGHAVGDAVLGAVSDGLRSAVRGADLVGRIGGDEFLVVLDGSVADADELMERVCMHLRAATFHANLDVDLEVSAGLAGRIVGDDFDAIVDRADRTMYQQKSTARSARYSLVDATVPAAVVD